MRATSFGVVALTALIGCASDPDDKDAQTDSSAGDQAEDRAGDHDDDQPPIARGLILRVVAGDGEVFPPGIVLATKDMAYIRLLGTPTAADVLDASYAFQVTDLDGNVVSSDPIACRRFHVNEFGRIDRVLPGLDASGAPCEHDVGIADNLLPVIQLIPFADAPVDVDGIMHFVVEIAPEGRFTSDSLQTTFDVLGPICGDGHQDAGEDCDDGNSNDHDGCSAQCKAEPC